MIDSELLEKIAITIFGHWRETPDLSPDEINRIWLELPDAIKKTWRVCAIKVATVINSN